MNIYLIEIPSTFVGYDCHDGHVVIAESRESASEMAAAIAGDEGADVWKEHPRIKCLASGIRGVEEVVLSSFNAG